jgi:hypothetical protein
MPLPRWDDVKLGRSASFAAGKPTRGIHMIDPTAVKMFRGTPEIDLTGTTGARFAVDPSFLSYDTVPIRVTAVVRGFGRGSPGFNLKYEYSGPVRAADDHGMVARGAWNSIQGDKPTTLSWDIPDPRFVGKYGANVWLACDSSAHSDFSVVSVSVTKL